MVTIYRDYEDEPEDEFLPLPDALACEFYELEMEGFTADISYYKQLLPRRGIILEMGCGTGRIARRMATKDRFVVGIDVSVPMLRLARNKQHPHCYYVCMDMVTPAFHSKFDVILIPYNTLNLLNTATKIQDCLQGCRTHLQPGGRLLVQLFVPTEAFVKKSKKTFQFQMFDHPKGGRVIKEIIKKYLPASRTIHIEERFRVRPMQEGLANSDWSSVYSIAGFSATQWLELFNSAGFVPTNICGDPEGTPYNIETTSALFATLSLQ